MSPHVDDVTPSPNASPSGETDADTGAGTVIAENSAFDTESTFAGNLRATSVYSVACCFTDEPSPEIEFRIAFVRRCVAEFVRNALQWAAKEA